MQHIVGKARSAECGKGKASVYQMTQRWKAAQDTWLDSDSAMLLREAITRNRFKASVEGLKAMEAAEVRRYLVCLQHALILHASELVHLRAAFY
jgi:trans-aconitate methyltransferase